MLGDSRQVLLLAELRAAEEASGSPRCRLLEGLGEWSTAAWLVPSLVRTGSCKCMRRGARDKDPHRGVASHWDFYPQSEL